ncbi:MAG: phosphopentomutase [Bdellovibrionales bacterium]|nr:phosphopentomutase [Bdellovibrionales bacterium]MCB9253813.1 phosphopentomutase [Pseudobdellovibrionaceae bacterium]
MSFKRVVVLVADGLGVGAAPDANAYGDNGSNTLGNTAHAVGGLRLPQLEKLGLGCLGKFDGLPAVAHPLAVVGRLAEKSAGKDTVTGHWEIAGLVTDKAFPVYPDGFPASLVDAFVKAADLPGVLGNYAASGTQIIQDLGAEHVRTGKPILYTSADSVFQLAAHEESFGLERLYKICEVARTLTKPLQLGRVIARPFVGPVNGKYVRTEHRRDYALEPPPNCLDWLQAAGVKTVSVGKIDDIFCHRGLSEGNHTGNNHDSLRATSDFLEKYRNDKAFIFVNLVDFDMLYGHRRDPKGFAKALVELDEYLPKILSALGPQDLLLITGDHGCDPTYRGSDHTREYVPLVAYSPSGKGQLIGDRQSFGEIARTLMEGYEIPVPAVLSKQESFLKNLYPEVRLG